MNNPKFRRRLQQIVRITDPRDLTTTRAEFRNQLFAIQELSREYPHTISLCREARMDDPSTYEYTCYMYAFDLMDKIALTEISRGHKDIYPRSDFASFLAEQFLSEISPEHAKDGDHVVYCFDNRPTHAGKVNTEKIISKWGKYGHLWRHGLYEVPLEYGDEVHFFQQTSGIRCLEAFMQWARLNF